MEVQNRCDGNQKRSYDSSALDNVVVKKHCNETSLESRQKQADKENTSNI